MMPVPFLKTAIFTVLAPGTVTALVPWLILRYAPAGRVDLGLARWAGAGIIAIGAAIYFLCAFDFAFFGRGTPAPIDAPKELVARHLYRFVRNPMYVGVLAAALGVSILFQSAIVLAWTALVAVVFHLFVVLYEEPHLRRTFGEPYVRYCQEVPRWLPKRTVR